MKKHESEHYVFYYDGAYIEENIEGIVSKQEKCYQYICSVLQMNPNYKIKYYLHGNPQKCAKASNEMFGTEYETLNGFACEGEIHAVYSETIKCMGFHEDAHLVSYVDGYGASVAVREGLAMFFDRQWWAIHNLHWTSYYVKKHMYIPIDKLIGDDDYFYSISDTISYPIMGAFTEWIINSYGIEKYKLFFKDENVDEASKKIFGKSLAELNSMFLDYVSLFSVDEAIEERMQTKLKGRE